jgi:hypothetical protein
MLSHSKVASAVGEDNLEEIDEEEQEDDVEI